ncbi:MAG: sigma-54 dependent transcriptional regulator [bacterium]
MKQAIYPAHPVIIVDDEEHFLLSVVVTLSSNGINNVKECQDSREVMGLVTEQDYSVMLLDLSMPHKSGVDLLPAITQEYPNMPVIMVTAVNEVETAVECMKLGAFDYLVKPVDEARLVTTLKRAIKFRDVQNENTLLKKYLLTDKLDHPDQFAEIITNDKNMRSIFQYVEAIGATSLPILITGETGVGKELVAQAIHYVSGRPGEFMPVNVAGVDDTLFSDTLFGHKKGGFTGADRDRMGLIEQAASGTLFLDEIGDLSLESQVKLLRLLQEAKYYPIGADTPKLTDARIVVATNSDIEARQLDGNFRKDLYYRLQAHHIHIPPLRDRKDDIPILVEHFLTKAGNSLNKKRPTPPRELMSLLRNYQFPGNVRELEGMIFDAVSRHKSGILSMESFKDKIRSKDIDHMEIDADESGAAQYGEVRMEFPDQLPSLRLMERMLVSEALRRADGNQTIAAQLLGLTRRALNNRLNRYR